MKVCPRCGVEYDGFPAISRFDNKTDICSHCGVEEGLQDYFGVELTNFLQQELIPHILTSNNNKNKQVKWK